MDKRKSADKTSGNDDTSLLMRAMNGPRDLFNVKAPLPRMGIEDYFLSVMERAYDNGQQELFPMSEEQKMRRVIMPFDDSIILEDIVRRPAAVSRKEHADYLVVQFGSVADKQMPLFSEAELPSAKSLKIFLGHPPGYRGLN